MKKSNTLQSSFSHNDSCYEYWYDRRYDFADEVNETININTVKAREIFAESVIDFLNDTFNTSLKYDGLYIPKYYNYESDRIKFSYAESDINIFLNAIKDYELINDLQTRIKDVTTSSSGYAAFYTADELIADSDLHISVILGVLFNSDYMQNEYDCYYDNQRIYESLEDSVTVESEGEQ